MAFVTLTTAEKFIGEYWEPELNRAVDYDMVIAKTFKDMSSRLPDGDTLHMPASHHLTANDKSAGTAATPEAITETEQTFVVSVHKIVAQDIEDFAKVQSHYDIRAEFNHSAGYALARAMDSAAAALLDDNTTQTVGVIGAEPTEQNFLDIRKFLRDAAAPLGWTGIVAPGTYNGALKIDRFTNSADYGAGADAITQAKLGKLYGMELVESNLTTGTSPQSYGCVYAPGHFFKIIQKKVTIDALYRPFDKAWEVAADTIFGMFERQEAVEAAAGTTTARLWCVRLEANK